jgi:hypothetical protein
LRQGGVSIQARALQQPAVTDAGHLLGHLAGRMRPAAPRPPHALAVARHTGVHPTPTDSDGQPWGPSKANRSSGWPPGAGSTRRPTAFQISAQPFTQRPLSLLCWSATSVTPLQLAEPYGTEPRTEPLGPPATYRPAIFSRATRRANSSISPTVADGVEQTTSSSRPAFGGALI